MQLPPVGRQTGHRAEESRALSLPGTRGQQLRGRSGFSWEALGQSSFGASADTEQVESKLQRALCAGVCLVNRILWTFQLPTKHHMLVNNILYTIF